MNSITKEYLVEIIFKKISDSIDIHRMSKRHLFNYQPCSLPTDDEVMDFIISIPFFDDKLKDFLIGNLGETTVIVSQNWENEFIIKTRMWTESVEWLHGNDNFLKTTFSNNISRERTYLGLPY
ncbi:MAG: hypothetical protein Q7T76_20265 [Ferruginibacter sp.]|nr:hypothetical protein [Ferruginibacter sp.]